ncbi:MAG: DUF1330 domain-containing protein [Burkholderiales bacterium]
MSACVIGYINVRDSQKWAAYRKQVPATILPFGGEVIFRGSQVAVLSGQHVYADTVVIRFPDREAVERWYQSDAYQALIPLREQAADMVLIAYQA